MYTREKYKSKGSSLVFLSGIVRTGGYGTVGRPEVACAAWREMIASTAGPADGRQRKVALYILILCAYVKKTTKYMQLSWLGW